ncbi:18S rRNA (guanine-N(7))-methyltransferase RID2 isoform X1 [Selaginella moellendorffii]|uniref:18S rRNA (guanine-N(7))-methyltransferase RID2 isoform X1 n=1 Tax=Selaginella moellendorffii TaxID=88036 RepID=UPI000D1C8D82|nr:18S rRNA (guanine-N(7))-methyltransferase RID2 isoform X1 [Selaginella moellendorffii]|eukprot:XP_024543963.1 18S rRNA (guanine-N(7))-methyltransferase RID2 isoform X1 [Selaginella moellendorffii]
MARPERQAPPELFYNESESRKYTTSSRIIHIQVNAWYWEHTLKLFVNFVKAKLTERAMELLALPDDKPKLLLDIGCGSGLSGESLSEKGHHWIGMDISQSMLEVALEREADGDLLLGDIGQGLGLRPGVFDGAISISAVQWLCNADKSCNDPRKRLKCFFTALFHCLARGARAVLQIYPENTVQLELITSAAMRCGFSGGLVVDYPHSSRAKKYFLCLVSGPPSVLPKPKGEDGGSESEDNEIDEDDEEEDARTVKFSGRERPAKRSKLEKKNKKGRDWILRKKEQRRKAGHEVPRDTKYTGRKRKARF